VSARAQKLGLVLTPAVALAIAAAGLRLGATQPIVSAVVYGAAPARGQDRLVWPIFTAVEEDGRQQGTALAQVTVVARSHGREATWRGATNSDGVAVATLVLPGVRAGDPVSLDVRDTSDVLARGDASWGPSALHPATAMAFRSWGARDGDIALDVAVEGYAVPTLFPATLWVRATDAATRASLGGVALDASSTLALEVRTPHAQTDALGWAKVDVRALAGGAGVKLAARDALGRSGQWTGLLPVDPRVVSLDVPPRIAPGTPSSIGVDAAGAQPVAYAELHDVEGVAAAAVLDVSKGAARFDVPPLHEGIYWFAVVMDPRGGPSSPGASVRPFFVAAGDAAALALGPAAAPCADGGEVAPCLACTAVAPVARWTALDGFVARRASDDATHRRARRIAFGALCVAAATETALILAAFLDARRRIRDAEARTPELVHARGRHSLVLLAASLSIALVGFGLMAALLMR
jgi:hypothetical protein